MEITRNTLDTSPGPADWFTGTVYIDTIAAPGEASTRLRTHLAMQLADDSGSPVSWGRHVSDDEYAQARTHQDGGR